METFNPPLPPDLGTNDERQFRTVRIAFGDGYSQRAQEGLNNRDRTLSMTWSLLSPAQADVICDFFDRHGGSAAFLFRRVDEAAPRKWIVERYARRAVQRLYRNVTATLTEVFDPE